MTSSATDSAPGLRERKKRATRIALSRAALRQTLEHGWDKVTVEGIAAEVDVSVRTFFNYFSSKEEAVMADTEEHLERVLAALRARPADEPILVAMRNALVGAMDFPDDEAREWVDQFRLAKREPSLLPYFIARQEVVEEHLVAAIADRTGTDAEHDLYPTLVATAASGAVKAAMRTWSTRRSPLPLATLITEALEQLGRGLPQPR
ncbi:TetR family transcriptional regulator [Microlunatus speluncae]|uniref:acyl-CoA-like ligand-binding transcription factor n=1 Tax=Microlunatus speluncae TaxID=2594267 RepID=UPI0013755E6D|nr:TetR family transcriptional regulator [Microlunatus speluncae]